MKYTRYLKIGLLSIICIVVVLVAGRWMFMSSTHHLGRAIGRLGGPNDYTAAQQYKEQSQVFEQGQYSQQGGSGFGGVGSFDNSSAMMSSPNNRNITSTSRTSAKSASMKPGGGYYQQNNNRYSGNNYHSSIATPPTDDLAATQEKQLAKMMIKKNANIRCETEDYRKYRANLNEAIFKHSAYLANENEQTDEFSIQNTITIRVPSDQFDLLLNEVSNTATKVIYRRVNAEDVTEQYTDLETRIKSKREAAKRYHEILSHARTVDEILQVEGGIRNLEEEIEAAEGRVRFLGDRVDYSTIELSIYQPLKVRPQVMNPEPTMLWQFGSAFKAGWIDLMEFLASIISAWPKWLLIGAMIYFGRKMWKKYKAKHPVIAA